MHTLSVTWASLDFTLDAQLPLAQTRRRQAAIFHRKLLRRADMLPQRFLLGALELRENHGQDLLTSCHLELSTGQRW